MNRRSLLLLLCGLSVLAGWNAAAVPQAGAQEPDAQGTAAATGRIRPWAADPRYWEYEGRPVLLLGGSGDDNLFQWPNLEEHLDAIKAAGGNYIRNTMSDRPDKGFEEYPFRKLENGKYDLTQWNDAYWKKFANLLTWTRERGIIVQIEVWDRFDYTDSKKLDAWQKHPYNPVNNVNYSYEESGFAERYPDHPGANRQPFFYTVPTLRNNETVLPYQQMFVNKLLSLSLEFPNVLYCMDNETSGEEAWGKYWATYIKGRAEAKGVEVYVTEMWDDWNVKAGRHRRTFDHPELYGFVDISQNNHNKGEQHWDNLQWVREYLAETPRPINTVKIYGADTGRFGNDRDGLERFWRNVIGGVAATRFHRPDSGLGLGDQAQAALLAARKLELLTPLWEVEPAQRLLTDRLSNEAYIAMDKEGNKYALYFPDGGKVTVDFSAQAGARYRLQWIDASTGDYGESSEFIGKSRMEVTAPGKGHWVAGVVKVE